MASARMLGSDEHRQNPQTRMKRVVVPLVLVLLLAGAGIYLQRRVAPQARAVAKWLPGGTILFEDVPDIHRTSERWPDTELAQIIEEPEVQGFLERPLREMPRRTQIDAWLAQERRIDPLHFFLAVTGWNGSVPNTIAGLCFGGSGQDVDAVVDDLRKEAQETWPDGKSDIEKYGSGEIETFTTGNFSAALAYRGRWFFISTDTGLLKATLDRFEGQDDPNSLAELPAFKNGLQHVPPAVDSFFFLRPALLADPVASLMLMVNPTADVHGADDIKKIDSVSVGTKLDGEVMRDAAYIVKSEPAGEPALGKDVVKLSSHDTIVLMSDRVGLAGDARMPDPKTDPSGVLELLDTYVKLFTDQGLGAEEFSKAFGPESGFVVDWPAGSVIPTPFAMVDVHDAALARKFLDTLATVPLTAGGNFTRQEAGPLALYSLPATGIGFFPIQVTLGLTDRCLIGALSAETVKQAALRRSAAGASREGVAAYKMASGLVTAPTSSFAYVDAKAIFGRVYGLFKGVASMGFVPHLADYVDLDKLPAPETITRHLSPMVASGSLKDGGLLAESAGPITTSQAVFITAMALGAVAMPMVEEEIKGQSVTIPGLPGFGVGTPYTPHATLQNQFASPLAPSISTAPATPPPGAAPGTPGSSASPSGGTP